MKKLNLLILSIFVNVYFTINVLAQQDPPFTQYWNTQNYYNPATSGADYRIQSQIVGRHQWANINSPLSALNANYSMNLAKKHGVGINYLYYQIGKSKTNRIKFNYAYHKQFKNELRLSIGIAATYSNLTMNLYQPPATPADTGYMSTFKFNSLTADLGACINYKKLNIGLSVIQLNERQLLNSSKYIFERAHLYGFLNYTFGKETGIQIQPNFLIKSDFIFKELNFNLLLKYKSKLMLGAGIQSRDSFSFYGGYDFYKQYRVAYSYDMTFSQLNNKLGGSHELCLAFLLK